MPRRPVIRRGTFSRGGAFDLDAAAGGNPHLRAMLSAMDGDMGSLYERLGMEQQLSQTGTTLDAPLQAMIKVLGFDGKFVVDITNPAKVIADSVKLLNLKVQQGAALQQANSAVMRHQLESCLNTNFDASGALIRYGGDDGDSNVHYEFQDPNVTRFWRIRSKYTNSPFNEWKFYEDPTVCGIMGVYSGMLRAKSNVYLNTGYTPDTTPTLTQVGVTTVIRMAANTWRLGDDSLSYLQADVDPGAFGTYYIYLNDPRKAGGAQTPVATTSNPDITKSDGRMYIGKITTAGGGGGTGGTGGGGGGGSGGGACVIGNTGIMLFDGSELPALLCRLGERCKGVDGGLEILQQHPKFALNIPCFRVIGANGLVLRGASGSHTVKRAGGGYEHLVHIVDGDKLETIKGATKVKKEFIGLKTVLMFHFDRTLTFICDGYFSHNALK